MEKPGDRFFIDTVTGSRVLYITDYTAGTATKHSLVSGTYTATGFVTLAVNITSLAGLVDVGTTVNLFSTPGGYNCQWWWQFA